MDPIRNKSGRKKYSVLVIDDQDNWRDLLAEILEPQFEVTRARDYRSALAAIERQKSPFHVVVTDMRLEDGQPGNQDGLKLAEYINQSDDETQAILVTGYPTIATVRTAFQSGAFDYVEKYPSEGHRFDIQQFQNRVEDAAREAEQARISRIKYLLAYISSEDESEQLVRDDLPLCTQKTYTIKLSISDDFKSGSRGITLKPRQQRKGRILLDLYIYCEHMIVERGTLERWDVPVSNGQLCTFEFSINPQVEGTKCVSVEIKQNHILRAYLTWKFNVTDQTANLCSTSK